MTTRGKTAYALWILFAINTMNFFDRQILGAVAEPVKLEWSLTDTELGWLGTAFTLLYALVGVPLGRLSDKTNRTYILSAGLLAWSLLTAAQGLAKNFFQLFALRLGVGVGEATCAPAATSLIGDLFPPAKRAMALSVFMLGLPIGVAMSYAISGTIAQTYGWRFAFFLAGIPGIIIAVAALFISEPARGGAESHKIGAAKREGSPYLLVLTIPTMWWIIISGALHNFNMYAIGSFLSPFLMRFHGTDVRDAGLISMVVFGLSGIPGLFLGGMLGDAAMKRFRTGRMLAAAICLSASVPLVYFALERPAGDLVTFTVLMSLACTVMYVYYSTVYSAIQDVIEPSLRGTAMALYFFAMYVLGASLGPLGMGYLSSRFTTEAALAAGETDLTFEVLAKYGAEGLHSALYVIPVLGLLLVISLFAGARTITRDMEKLQKWMRSSSEKEVEAEKV